MPLRSVSVDNTRLRMRSLNALNGDFAVMISGSTYGSSFFFFVFGVCGVFAAPPSDSADSDPATSDIADHFGISAAGTVAVGTVGTSTGTSRFGHSSVCFHCPYAPQTAHPRACTAVKPATACFFTSLVFPTFPTLLCDALIFIFLIVCDLWCDYSYIYCVRTSLLVFPQFEHDAFVCFQPVAIDQARRMNEVVFFFWVITLQKTPTLGVIPK